MWGKAPHSFFGGLSGIAYDRLVCALPVRLWAVNRCIVQRPRASFGPSQKTSSDSDLASAQYLRLSIVQIAEIFCVIRKKTINNCFYGNVYAIIIMSITTALRQLLPESMLNRLSDVIKTRFLWSPKILNRRVRK